MPDNEVIPRLLINEWPPKFSGQLFSLFQDSLPVWSGQLSLQSDSRDARLIQELTYLYQTTRLAYEHSQRVQALIRPFLSNITWREAATFAWRNGPNLPSKICETSILRLDIANFSKLMDNYPLEQVLASLSSYLDKMSRLVYEYHGDVDKYLGDGFLAVFITADDAVAAGCALQQAVSDFNHNQMGQGSLVFPTRVGIDSGRVALTSLGSTARQDRTVMGKPVNLAERLQAQATPGQVWFSEATFARLQDQSGCRCLGAIDIKGRLEPVVVYEKEVVGTRYR